MREKKVNKIGTSNIDIFFKSLKHVNANLKKQLWQFLV